MSSLSFGGPIDFEGLVNARDAGGKPIAGVGRARSGYLFRSETPELMTPADLARATGELGISRVIDLRGSHSKGSGPLGDDGRHVLLDFFELAGGNDTIDPSPNGFLPGLLVGGGAALGTVLEQLVAAPGPVLIHCHTGKDRTGFTIAMTLALLGVSDDDIITDYEHSITVFDSMLTNLEAAGMGIPPEAPEYARHAPSPDGIRELLQRLRAGWDSPRAYLLSQGVDSGLLDKVCELLTEADATDAAT